MISQLLFLSVLVAAPETAPTFSVLTTTGERVQGELKELTTNGQCSLSQGAPLPNTAWLSLQRVGLARPAYSKQPHLLFTNGDSLVGNVRTGDGDAVYWRPRLGVAPENGLRFPTSALAQLWLQLLTDEPTWMNAPRRRDYLQLKNGDVLLGTVSKIEPTDWQFLVEQRVQPVPAANIVALGFNTDLARVRQPKGIYYRVVLRDGTRLSCAAVLCDGKELSLTTLFKEQWRIPCAELVAIDVEQTSAVALGNIKPTNFAYASFDGEQATWRANRTMHGHPLQLRTPAGAATYEHGLGIPAGSTLTYKLAGKYTRFLAVVGMDITQGERGTCSLQVTRDGKPYELPRGGQITVRDGLLTLVLDVRQCQELQLHIKRSDGGIVQAAVNMVDAYLVP